MASYTYVKNVKNGERLVAEIKNAGFADVLSVNMSSGNVTVNLSSELTTEQETTLANIVAAHALITNTEAAGAVVEAAMTFGSRLTAEFTAENVALGITQLGLTNHVRKTLREVKDAVETGSLYDAITEIKNIDPLSLDANILSASRLLAFRNKIETYLHVPLATAWDDPETWL
jgi:hypothetical protein